VTARDEMSAVSTGSDILTDDMLAMDVADTLRRDDTLRLDDPEIVPALQALYRELGIEISDSVAKSGLAAANDRRFTYAPPQSGLGAVLARLYVMRRTWLPAATAIALAIIVGGGGYFLVYRPYHEAQIEQAQRELTQVMPAQMDALYETIFEETKVQQATNDASDVRTRGKDAAQKGDRAGAQQAIDDLTNIRDTLRLDYQLRIVDGDKWGFWSFPKSNSDATNYYLIVQAIDAGGTPLSLPIHSEDSGRTETVSAWGERVPEEVYRAVEADKSDDGVIEHNLVAIKDFGFLQPDYVLPVLGGEVTRW